MKLQLSGLNEVGDVVLTHFILEGDIAAICRIIFVPAGEHTGASLHFFIGRCQFDAHKVGEVL